MPCQDGRDFSPIVAQREINDLQRSVKLRAELHQKELNEYADMLCELCRHLENLQIPMCKTFTAKVARWWKEHKLIDARRQEREQKEAEAIRAKETAEYVRLKQKLGL